MSFDISEEFIKQMNDEEAYSQLREVGFTVLEISRLIRLRRDYTAKELDQIAQDQAPCVSPPEKMSTLKTVVGGLSLRRLKGIKNVAAREVHPHGA
jgi:hypothetical protein